MPLEWRIDGARVEEKSISLLDCEEARENVRYTIYYKAWLRHFRFLPIILAKERKIKTENGLMIQSKRNRFSAGRLTGYAVGWCEREVTRLYRTERKHTLIMKFYYVR